VVRKKTTSLPAVHVSSLLFICALLPALLFKGPQIEFFAVTQIVLVIWLGWIVLHSHGSGLRIPKTSLALCLTLFWLWLALSLTWSLAPNISVINFWWVGSLALVFWLYTLTPDRDALWSHAAAILLVIGLVLALMGIYQVHVLEQQARSVFETRNTHAAFLNLVALPASAYFLQAIANKAVSRHYSVVLGTILFFLFLSIFLTASRGATLSLAIGVGLLAALTLRCVPRRALAMLFALLALAFVVTKISAGGGGLGENLPQLLQDAPRRMIWESSWNLLQASPWQGIGLGLFYLAYPPYRNPVDSSGGYFAHNDYLQIWIEAGLPGLVLLLAVLAAAFILFVRALRKTGLRRGDHIEMTGLFCGLLVVAGHSVVDFNLYILSIMMISGLAMGRFHELAAGKLKAPSLLLRPSRYVGKQAYPLIVLLLVLLPFFYFVALGTANSHYDKGMALAREGRLQEAEISLVAARRLAPSDDRTLIARADLYRHVVTVLPADEFAGKKALYENALWFLDRAQQANSLRGLIFVVRGQLYQQNPEFAGENGNELAAESFRRALALNPRLYQARMGYVSLLLQAGRKDEALQALSEGVGQEYQKMPEVIPFYVLAARLMREAGRVEEALVLENRVRQLEMLTTTQYRVLAY
jgi:O-antigen ligase